jgi:hypothetical protein
MAEMQSTAGSGAASGERGQDEIGRSLVRRLLIDRLRNAGLSRARGQKEAALAEMLDHLASQLDHMTSDNLMSLADAVLDHASAPGPTQGQWPREVMIIAWGRGLQARPFRLHRIVTSWLASREGPIAEAAGYEVQLLRFLRRHQRPPTEYDLTECKAAAREDNRLMCLITDRIARGVVQDVDRDWHSAYLADQQLARSMVDRGQDARAAQSKEAAA